MGDIVIRKAVDSDFDFFYSIKCDDDNLYWAGHALPPIRENLYHFFSSHIRNQNILNKRTIFIAEDKHDGKSLGYLYLDPTGSDSAEIGIGILNSCSGRGYGRKAVCQMCDLAWIHGFNHIYANIREDNLRSQRMFQHAGFTCTGIYHYKFIENLNREVKMIRFEQRHSPPPLRWGLPTEKAVSSTTAKTTE